MEMMTNYRLFFTVYGFRVTMNDFFCGGFSIFVWFKPSLGFFGVLDFTLRQSVIFQPLYLETGSVFEAKWRQWLNVIW